jgi:hypothetical protein
MFFGVNGLFFDNNYLQKCAYFKKFFKNSSNNPPKRLFFLKKFQKNKEKDQKNVESRIFVQNSSKASPNPFNPTPL